MASAEDQAAYSAEQAAAYAASLQSQHQPPPVYNPEQISHRRQVSLKMLRDQESMTKERLKADMEAKKQQINMKYDHEVSLVSSSVEQSRQAQLFALDQQHQQMKVDIEQKAAQQRMQIENTANSLLMAAQQQKVQVDITNRMEKMRDLQKEQEDLVKRQAAQQDEMQARAQMYQQSFQLYGQVPQAGAFMYPGQQPSYTQAPIQGYPQ